MIPNSTQVTPLAGPRGLLGVAAPIGEGWETGVDFGSGQCLSPERVTPCPEDYTAQSDSSEVLRFRPFEARMQVDCTAVGSAANAAAIQTVEATLDALVGTALMEGDGSNPYLQETLTLYQTASVAEAVACLEAFAAQTLFGRQAFIHAPYQLSYAMAPNLVFTDGVFRTPAGSIVVFNAGYSGAAPNDAGEAETLHLYVSGTIWAATGPVESTVFVDRSTNTLNAVASAPAIVAFDPCAVAAADTGVAACEPTTLEPGVN